MIYILHGSDLGSVYLRLQALVNKYQSSEILKFGPDKNKEDLILSAFSTNLLDDTKAIIVENFLKEKKIKAGDLKKIPVSIDLFFWENEEISKSLLYQFQKIAHIENFKLQTQLFQFLDSIKPKAKLPFVYLTKFSSDQNLGLIWHLSGRLYLLILAKNNFTYQKAAQLYKDLSRASLYDWQWERIHAQARQFNLQTLMKLFNGTLKIDYLVKTGHTGISPKTLISLLLFKYLQA